MKTMKNIFLMLALAAGAIPAGAQDIPAGAAVESAPPTPVGAELPPEPIGSEPPGRVRPTFGEYFEGYSRAIAWDRMIPPYALEVTFEKTTHIIFPAPVVYVDLGSAHLIAAKADGAENVLRVKAAVRGCDSETNLAVITSDGSFYAFSAHVM
jgi:hypothetical protein